MEEKLKGLGTELRKQIRERDKACVYCSDELGPFEIDHVRPRRFGGHDDAMNLVLACQRCNQLKGAQSVDRFLERMRQVKEGKLEIVVTRIGSYKRYAFRRKQ